MNNLSFKNIITIFIFLIGFLFLIIAILGNIVLNKPTSIGDIETPEFQITYANYVFNKKNVLIRENPNSTIDIVVNNTEIFTEVEKPNGIKSWEFTGGVGIIPDYCSNVVFEMGIEQNTNVESLLKNITCN